MAKEIVRDLGCPVWVIPEDTAYKSYNDVIYATDYHEEDIQTIKKLIEITTPLTPKIEALHITDNVDFENRIKQKGFQDMLKERIGYRNVEAKALVENVGEEMVEMLNQYAVSHGADLMVVLRENRPFLERLFKPSSSDKIIEDAKLPVLVFHEN
jgi:nucleotide-binding universal stress UspA family protein